MLNVEFRVSVIIIILVVLDLRCCAQAFCSCEEWGFLIALVPLAAEHSL